VIAKGPNPRELPRGREIAPVYVAAGREHDVASFMDRNVMVGILVIHRGRIVLERYGLGLQEHDRWSTMSTVKSMTAMLVGAAVRDGAIKSIDDPLTTYLPALRDSAYEGVTLRHVMTMSSGVRWTEVYPDRNSDVNRYSKSLADKVPDGVLKLMASLPRAHPPGSTFLYNSGGHVPAGRRAHEGRRQAPCRLHVGEGLAARRHGVRCLLYAGERRRAGDRR